jgi:hypothetical protein
VIECQCAFLRINDPYFVDPGPSVNGTLRTKVVFFTRLGKNFDDQIRRAFDPVLFDDVGVFLSNEENIGLVDVDVGKVNVEWREEDASDRIGVEVCGDCAI